MGKLIWLASYPKSGNTWLRAFLHNYLRDGTKPHDINRLLDLTATEDDAALYRPLDPRPAGSYTIEEVQRMRPLVHRQLMASFPDYVFVKTHNAWIDVAGYSLVTAEVTAGAIYIVRDPRDVAISYGRYLGRPLDEIVALMNDGRAAIGGNDAHVFERLGSWSDHVASWTRPRGLPLLILRYEDMHAAPATAFGRVAQFLGAADDPARLDKAIRFSSFAELQAQEAAAGFLERPDVAASFFRSGRPGEWRRTMDAASAARIERRHGAIMARFGYTIPSLA